MPRQSYGWRTWQSNHTNSRGGLYLLISTRGWQPPIYHGEALSIRGGGGGKNALFLWQGVEGARPLPIPLQYLSIKKIVCFEGGACACSGGGPLFCNFFWQRGRCKTLSLSLCNVFQQGRGVQDPSLFLCNFFWWGLEGARFPSLHWQCPIGRVQDTLFRCNLFWWGEGASPLSMQCLSIGGGGCKTPLSLPLQDKWGQCNQSLFFSNRGKGGGCKRNLSFSIYFYF